MQIDKAVTAPGVFAPARTFSLVDDDAGVYLIYTGRAMSLAQPVAPGIAGVAAGAILDGIARKRAVEIAGVEAKLRASGAAALKDTRHSRFIPRDAIKQVTIADGSARGGWAVVTIVADKKHKLHFPATPAEEVKAFFAPFLA